MMRRWFGLSATLLFLCMALSLAGPPARGAAPVLTIAPTEFGLAFINSAETLRSDARLQRGITAGARLDRFPLYWNFVESSPGQFDWSKQDAALRANERQGLGTLAILLGTPGHYYPTTINRHQVLPMPAIGGGPIRDLERLTTSAVNQCSGTPPPRGLYEPIFADGSDWPGGNKVINPANPWARFVEEAVTRYRPGGSAGLNVRHWEVWNEPDLCHFWSGTAQDYARLLKVAYLVIKQRDPEATVIWGGLAHFQNSTFLYELVSTLRDDPMASSFGGFFDAATSHHYSNVTLGFTYTRRIQTALRTTPWPDKPVWITESGVPICNGFPGPECPSPYRATPIEQASYIWQNVAYTRLAGGGPIFHFQLYDDAGNECRAEPPADGFGLITNEPDSPCTPHNSEQRLAYRAFQLATHYFAGAEFLWADIQEGAVRRVAFYDPATRERRLLVWAIGGSDALARVPAAGTVARRISLDGSEESVVPLSGEYQMVVPPATSQNQPTSTTYTIGGVPYLLVERDTLPPLATITELSPISPPTFEVAWQASDPGSGLVASSVALWWQMDGGPWQRWLEQQPSAGSALFTGTVGHTYRFGLLAADRAGNGLTTPLSLAETLVGDGAQRVRVTGQVLTMSGQPAAGALLSIGAAGAFADGAGHFDFPLSVGRWDVAVQGQVLSHGESFLSDRALTLRLPPLSNVIDNGDFETALAGWTVGGTSPVGIEERGGTRDHALRLASAFVPAPGVPGEEGSAGGNATISRQVQLPLGSPHLSFYYRVESDDSAPDQDKVEVIVARDTLVDYVYMQQESSDWGYRSLDLSAHAGQSVTLIFNVYESSPQRRTTVLLDQVMVGESPTLLPIGHIYLPVAR
ncbi:MAG: hypothetical protein H0T73_14595 [Ardenticatenales bacterium]|nr:hypothetical protein [Ardenticatenales bacterium]